LRFVEGNKFITNSRATNQDLQPLTNLKPQTSNFNLKAFNDSSSPFIETGGQAVDTWCNFITQS